MSELRISPDLALPPEAALQRFGILAMSGAGKSNAAVVLAEEMSDAGIPWVAIDPKGDWWGVRSSKSGTRGGLKVPVFGGLHGDVPLEEGAGALLAGIVAEKRLTCVLDVSEMSKTAQLRFLTDFAETLLKKNRAPLMVIAEEADEYLPQRVMKSEARCVGAWQRLVKRGRFRGVFVTLVSQRSAALNKDALSQIDTLIPMRVGDPRDKKALKEWVVEHDIGQEMFDSLPRLDDGEAWVWSPHKLKIMERIKFRRRRTFDSGATPDWEDRAPVHLADVDLSAIEAEIADTRERAKQEDPKELRRTIAELRSELAREKEKAPEAEVREVPVEVPVFPPELKAQMIEALELVGKALEDMYGGVGSAIETIGNVIEHTKADWDVDVKPMPKPKEGTPRSSPSPQKSQRQSQAPRARPTGTSQRSVAQNNGEVTLGRAARVLLETLVQRAPMKLSRAQLSTLSGYRPRSSTYANALSELRTNGLIEQEGAAKSALFAPSDAGMKLIGDVYIEPKSPQEVQRDWLNALPPTPALMLEHLIGVYPHEVTREALGEAIDRSTTSSTFANGLSALRTNGLLEDVGRDVRASEALFT